MSRSNSQRYRTNLPSQVVDQRFTRYDFLELLQFLHCLFETTDSKEDGGTVELAQWVARVCGNSSIQRLQGLVSLLLSILDLQENLQLAYCTITIGKDEIRVLCINRFELIQSFLHYYEFKLFQNPLSFNVILMRRSIASYNSLLY